MGLPSQKRSKTSKKQRASHFALKATALVKCAKCGKPVLSHRACEFCGTYKGKQVLTIKTAKDTEKRRAQERKKVAREKDTQKTK